MHSCARPVLPPLSALPERFAGPACTQGAQTAGCSFGGLQAARWWQCNLSPVGCRAAAWRPAARWSVLLPERSDCCNQPSCAFGGLHWGGSLL